MRAVLLGVLFAASLAGQTGETAGAKPPPLDEAARSEFTRLVRDMRDAQVAELRRRVAILEAKLAAVEELLIKEHAAAAALAMKRLEGWQASLAGDSGCVLTATAEWVTRRGEPCGERAPPMTGPAESTDN